MTKKNFKPTHQLEDWSSPSLPWETSVLNGSKLLTPRVHCILFLLILRRKNCDQTYIALFSSIKSTQIYIVGWKLKEQGK